MFICLDLLALGTLIAGMPASTNVVMPPDAGRPRGGRNQVHLTSGRDPGVTLQ